MNDRIVGAGFIYLKWIENAYVTFWIVHDFLCLAIQPSELVSVQSSNLKCMYFKEFSPENQVSGRAILNAVNSLVEYKMTMAEYLTRSGLDNIEPDGWYDEQAWLDVLQAISKQYGPSTIFTLGKGVGSNLPGTDPDFRNRLDSIDSLYKKSHINGEVGYFKLMEFDEKNKRARMKMHTPYPPEYGKGVLTAMVRKYKPDLLSFPKVEVETITNEEAFYLVVSW